MQALADPLRDRGDGGLGGVELDGQLRGFIRLVLKMTGECRCRRRNPRILRVAGWAFFIHRPQASAKIRAASSCAAAAPWPRLRASRSCLKQSRYSEGARARTAGGLRRRHSIPTHRPPRPVRLIAKQQHLVQCQRHIFQYAAERSDQKHMPIIGRIQRGAVPAQAAAAGLGADAAQAASISTAATKASANACPAALHIKPPPIDSARVSSSAAASGSAGRSRSSTRRKACNAVSLIFMQALA